MRHKHTFHLDLKLYWKPLWICRCWWIGSDGEIFLDGCKCPQYVATNIWKCFTARKSLHLACLINFNWIFQEVTLHFCNLIGHILPPVLLTQRPYPSHAFDALWLLETFFKRSYVLCPQWHSISIYLQSHKHIKLLHTFSCRLSFPFAWFMNDDLFLCFGWKWLWMAYNSIMLQKILSAIFRPSGIIYKMYWQPLAIWLIIFALGIINCDTLKQTEKTKHQTYFYLKKQVSETFQARIKKKATLQLLLLLNTNLGLNSMKSDYSFFFFWPEKFGYSDNLSFGRKLLRMVYHFSQASLNFQESFTTHKSTGNL